MSAIEAETAAAAARPSALRSPTLWTGLAAVGWTAFLYDTEPDWFYFLPVAAVWAGLTAVIFAVTGRWRFAALAAGLVFLAINAAARLKFAMVAMSLHVFDALFHASLTQLEFFVHTFPKVAGAAAALIVGAIALLVAVWRREPRSGLGWRARAGAALGVCLAAAPATLLFGAYNTDFFNDRRHGLSSFLSSFRDLPDLWRNGALIETAGLPASPVAAPPLACKPAGKAPHIILFLNESGLPPGVYPGLPFAEEAAAQFRSIDGTQRRLRVETFGGATWLSDFSTLTGLSTRDLGSMRNFAAPFTTGRLAHALPAYLKACGYDTTAIYPVPGEFGGTARFYRSIGFDRVVDQAIHKAPTDQERDAFYYDVALGRLAEAKGSGRPQFISLASMATHAPWDFRLAPEAVKRGEKLVWSGDRDYDEFMWRLVLGARDRAAFKQALAERFPGEPFLIVSYGDHQPALKKIPLRDPTALAGDGRWAQLTPTSIAFETYYQIDAVNFAPRMPPQDIAILDIPNLSTILVDAARLPRDAWFDRRADLIERCGGLYATCPDRQAVVEFQTWLVAAGWLRAQ
ncbi:MAG: sulfatase-like hydrolase/transferase [Methylobacteriaceae bacterium]|nr:sulfatase-like hydrolase/transferase [Methylobacteriaceae bacterium]